MSYYTKFADVESLLTSTTTSATLAATDAVLVTNVSAGHPFQSTPGAIAQMPWTGAQTLTSASTGTNILANGLTVLQSSNAVSYLLTAPTVAGQFKYITSTSSAVITVVCSAASLMSSGSAAGSQLVFNSAGAAISGGAACLVSVGSTRWVAFNSGAITIYS